MSTILRSQNDPINITTGTTTATAAFQIKGMRSTRAFLYLTAILDRTEAWTSKIRKQSSPIPASPALDVARRSLVASALVAALTISTAAANAAAVRAVGSGEIACRKAGNCLEVGELDGAVGWGWGGKDRCDASDPKCGTDGKLRETAMIGQPVPSVPRLKDQEILFTHIAAIEIGIGREGEIGVLKLGFYGNEAPGAVSELVDFLSVSGLITNPASQNSIGAIQPAVSLQTGGTVTGIVPNEVVELGVPSQSNAYARSLGRSKAGDNFVPQPRPAAAVVNGDLVVRRHDCAGLVSSPEQGVGYGGSGFESEDECFGSAFLITASAAPTLDKGKRRVVGQVLDADSMAFLERLANVPTKRGIRGVIPGQTFGPPLPKVVVRQVQVSVVKPP